MASASRLYLIRHGQTDLNRDARFRGLSDVPLNEQGKREAAGAGRLLESSRVERVYTSPVRRAAETAAAIACAIRGTVEVDDDFTDIDYGQWQGLTVDEVRARFGEAQLRSWRKDPCSFTFPGGDSIASVRGRLEPALLGAVTGAEAGSEVAVVSHLAVLKICFVVLMGLDMGYFWKVGLDNGAVSAFGYSEAGGFTLERWNRSPEW